ncbi:hypothetical protein [Microvirga ossetica]|uniref:hypothetical protein n=1 Tax=Microvirga ossetica TaxID=1882682 RepID=UPI0012FFFB35|nr:hypothetical protein [Microvirga ossetica]
MMASYAACRCMSETATSRDHPLPGSAFMLVALAFFSCSDAASKPSAISCVKTGAATIPRSGASGGYLGIDVDDALTA